MAAAKLGTSRKIVIPKDICEKLGLTPGDYVDFKVRNSTAVMKRKSQIDEGIARGIADHKAGRYLGPFDNAEDAMRALRKKTRK